MHTTNNLKTTDFNFLVNCEPACLEDIFPGFNADDRIGIVVKRSGGGLGTGALLLAAVTRFYDFYRPYLSNHAGGLRIYPEFFIFHTDEFHMDHRQLDVWPPHKEIVVKNEAEKVLEAINDRGVTRLLIEDNQPTSEMRMFLPETVNSAKQRIVTTLAYSPTGRTKHSDIEVMSCPAAEKYIHAAVNMSSELSNEKKDDLLQCRREMAIDGRTTETYRMITLIEGIKKII